MKEFEEAKREYESTPIPQELDGRVREGIRQGRENRRKMVSARRRRHALGGIAACLVLAVAGLNASPAFAAAAADVPVLGGLFQVLTIRSYHAQEENAAVEIDQPALEGGGTLTERVNQEISERVEAREAEGRRIVEEYKEAFLATGGTEEEWDARPAPEVHVSYEVKSQTDSTVSFVLNSYVSVFHSTEEQIYYNLDLAANRELTLADVLGENWIADCNEAVKAQIAGREDADMFFSADEGGFTTVDESTRFYLNEAGNPVVVFPRYAIAPGYLGAVEFEIAA